MSIRTGDIILTLLSSFDSGGSRDTHTAFIPPLVLFATPVKQVMITDHDPRRGDGHELQERANAVSRCCWGDHEYMRDIGGWCAFFMPDADYD